MSTQAPIRPPYPPGRWLPRKPDIRSPFYKPTQPFDFPARRPYRNPNKRQGRDMTIALGFLCSDGIVMGSDMQFTTWSQHKVTGEKLFTIAPSDDATLCIAGAGATDLTQLAVETLEERLRQEFSAEPASGSKIRAVLQDVVSDVFEEHIRPIEGQPGFSLLAGAWTKNDGLGMWWNQQSTPVCSVKHHACIGSGTNLAEYLMDKLTSPTIKQHQAKYIAMHVIHQTKEYSEGCGKPTVIRILQPTGCVDDVDLLEISDFEAYSAYVTMLNSYLLGSGLTCNPQNSAIDLLVQEIKEQILEYQRKKEGRRI